MGPSILNRWWFQLDDSEMVGNNTVSIHFKTELASSSAIPRQRQEGERYRLAEREKRKAPMAVVGVWSFFFIGVCSVQ